MTEFLRSVPVVSAPDMAAAKAFYVDVLGFVVAFEMGPAYAAIPALVRCSLGDPVHRTNAVSFDSAQYYPATLDMLSLLATLESHPECVI